MSENKHWVVPTVYGSMGWQRQRCSCTTETHEGHFPSLHKGSTPLFKRPSKVARLQLPFQQGRVGQKNILNYSAHVGCSAVRSFGTGLPSKITSCETWGTTADTVVVLTHKPCWPVIGRCYIGGPKRVCAKSHKSLNSKGEALVARLKLKGSWRKGATRSIALNFCS